MSEKKKGGKEFDNPYSVAKAVTKGNALTKLSMVVLGLGNIAHHQIIKGLGMLAIEIAFIAFMVMKGAGYITAKEAADALKVRPVLHSEHADARTGSVCGCVV